MKTCSLPQAFCGLMDQDTLNSLYKHLSYFAQQKAAKNLERTMHKFPNIVHKYLFLFKERCDIEINTWHWYESLLIQI